MNDKHEVVGFSEIKKSPFSRAVLHEFVQSDLDETNSVGKTNCQQILEKSLANGYLIFVNRDISDAEKFKNIIYKAMR